MSPPPTQPGRSVIPAIAHPSRRSTGFQRRTRLQHRLLDLAGRRDHAGSDHPPEAVQLWPRAVVSPRRRNRRLRDGRKYHEIQGPGVRLLRVLRRIGRGTLCPESRHDQCRRTRISKELRHRHHGGARRTRIGLRRGTGRGDPHAASRAITRSAEPVAMGIWRRRHRGCTHRIIRTAQADPSSP